MKPGDKVKLKSGGPHMTISSIEKENAKVCWFRGPQLQTGVFPLAVLKPTCSDAQRVANDRIRKAKVRKR